MSERRLIHYSSEPLKKVISVKQNNSRMKPRGLWLSVEGARDWLSWCQSEKWGLESLVHATEVTLKPDADVLRISTAAGIDRLTKQYRTEDEPPYILQIDWRKVARDYQGLIIAPYCWQRRLDANTGWYYGWDCASGCVWDADAVAEIKQLDWKFAVEEERQALDP